MSSTLMPASGFWCWRRGWWFAYTMPMSKSSSHVALNLLLQQVLDGDLLPEDPSNLRIGMLRARAHPDLARLARNPAVESLSLQSTFKPDVNALQALGLTVSESLSGVFDVMLFVPTRQRRESLACYVEAMQMLRPGGRLIVSCANDMGAPSYEKALRKLAGLRGARSKAHSRLFWTEAGGEFDPALAAEWVKAAEPTTVPGTDFVTVPGIYGWQKVDQGSQLLAKFLPENLSGSGMDLGCNYGYLAHALLSRADGVKCLHLVEAEARALACARTNLAAFSDVDLRYHWLDVAETHIEHLDFVLLNPPFHAGKETDYQLGKSFVETACRSLRRGGRLFMVANQFLSYEDVLARELSRHERLTVESGFKVLTGVK